MKPKGFVNALSSLDLEDTFNPYSNFCEICDLDDAPQIRSLALLGMLKAAEKVEIDSIWIGRDLGYRGGRRTGLALTDDIHVAAHAERWGVKVKRATKGQPIAERTAAVIWSMLEQIKQPVFLWNVFPLHPYEPSNEFTNRSHNSKERKIGEDFLNELILILRPRRLIAIGNDAFKAAHKIRKNEEIVQIRHPSYGGQNIFLKQVEDIYGVCPVKQERLFG